MKSQPLKDSPIPMPAPSTLVRVCVILAAVCWIYWPTLHGSWLWEDDLHITANPLLHDPDRLWKIWFQPGSLPEYYPIEATAQWVQWQLWHTDTPGYHVTNVLLHLSSALLVWRLLQKLGLSLAWLGGLIFAIHPVMVESVAWITEFKNALSLPPFLLAICFYLDYESRHRPRDYFSALGFFLVAMLCKPTMVMFPVVLLLYAWWKRGRIGWRDVRASAPFFVISLLMGVITIWSNIQYAQIHLAPKEAVYLHGFFPRIACAGLCLSFYFSKVFLPVGLEPIYPYWNVNSPSLAQFLPWPILAGSLFWLWQKRTSWGRHALLGLGFFLIMLAPFVFVLVGGWANFTWVMDHFLYIPIIGLIGVTVAALDHLRILLSPTLRYFGIAILTVILAVFAWGSHAYAEMFVDQQTLWTYAAAHNPEAWLARYNLGEALLQNDHQSEAMNEFDMALQINPDLSQAHNNLGLMLLNLGRVTEARNHLEAALRINPNYAEAQDNLGLLLFRSGKAAESLDHYQKALQLNPYFDQAYNNLGNALSVLGRNQEALDQYENAMKVNPDYAMPHNNLGLLLLHARHVPEAIEQFETALQINPQLDDTRNNLGIAYFQSGLVSEAMEQFESALQINPNYAEAHNNLGIVLAQTGHNAEAAEQFADALRLNPQFTDALNNLKKLQAAPHAAPAKH